MFRSDRSLTTTSGEKPGRLSNNDGEDENESVTKEWIHVASNFIALIPSRLIRQTLAIFFRAEFCSTVSKFRKRKRKWLSCVPVLDKTCIYALSRRSRAMTAKKCTKKVMHVQSCCSADLNLLLFCRSRCRRRRRCLSSLPFLAINSLPDWSYRSFCLARCKAPGNIWVLPVNLSPSELHRLTVLPGFPWSPRSPDTPGAPLKDSESFV